MSKELKLNCPLCEKQFTTKRRDQVWCSRSCSRKYGNIKNLIKANYNKQDNMKDNSLEYNFDKDIFIHKKYIKP